VVKQRILGTADQRRVAVLSAAVSEFSAHGLAGASTTNIALRAQIAHSYVFKLFGSKVQLFLAATDHVYDRIAERFTAAVHGAPDAPLEAMGTAYQDMLGEREDLLVLLHGFAAAGDPAVGPTVRRRYTDLYSQVQAAADASDERMRQFWAQGMLLTVAAAIELPLMTDQYPWVAGLLRR
jgi:AcrR family transcriptional regulator